MNTSAHTPETLDLTVENPGRKDLVMFGFWTFMMSDAILFALLFASYGVLLRGTAGGPGPREILDLNSAAVETALLLASSFTMGLATLAVKFQRGRGRALGWMAVTLALGIAFLFMEIRDFQTLIASGAGPARSGYLSAFFALVSTHGLHVLAGSTWMVVLMLQVRRFGLDDPVQSNALRLGLFWHFLDIIWVGILSVVYLQGVIR